MGDTKSWKIVSTEYLVKAPWAVLRKDKCQMPNGQIVPEYYVLEYPNWVNIIALTEEGSFVLVKQYRHGIAKEVLEICGGVIDPGEDAITAAERELMEETGYAFKEIKELAVLYPNPATSNNMTTTFLATGCKKVQEQHLDEQEEIDVLLVSVEEVKQLLKENQFGQALHTAALFYALSDLGYLR